MSPVKLVRLISASGIAFYPIGTWVVCAQCYRAYRLGEYRSTYYEGDEGIRELKKCPFPSCKGLYPLDAIPWDLHRLEEMKLPIIPTHGKKYPL